MSHVRIERDGAVGVITIDRARAVQLARRRDRARPAHGRAADGARRGGPRRGAARRGRRVLQRRRSEIHRVRRRRRRPRLPHAGVARHSGRLRRALQADPRVPAQHDLRDPPRAQAVHRRGGRHRRRRRLRPGDVVRSRARLAARHLRVGLRQDRADRRRELHVHAAAPDRAAPRHGADAAQPAARPPSAPSRSAWSPPWSTPTRSTSDVLAIAHTLADGPTHAFATAKALLNQAAGVDRLDFHLDHELQHLVRSADSAEFHEGLRAFFEKRAPVFRSRG